MKDGNGNKTTLSYADSPSGGNAAGNSNAYLTTLTLPSTNNVPHVRSFQYNYTTSEMVQSTDENVQPTNYSYIDSLLRLTDVYQPPNAAGTRPHTHYAYSDGASPTVTTTGPAGIVSVDVSDGLGRKIESEITSTNPPIITSYVVYNGVGTVASAYNPTYCSSPTSNCGESTWGYTTYLYDSLGRRTQQQTQPDKSKRQWCYENIPSTGQSNCHARLSSVAGIWIDSSDENGNDWQRTSDGFGRLTALMEPNGVSSNPPTMETDYGYNALNNLLSVAQNGAAGGTARNRSFVYNPISQLVQAFNPEAGTVCYGVWSGSACGNGYDANGNLTYKTDARGVVTNYGYDALNRLYAQTYTYAPAGTLSSCYQYDTATNGVGRLAAEWTQAGSCSSTPPANYQSLRTYGAYDAMGRVVTEQQCVAGFCTSASVPSQPTANCPKLSSATGLQYCYDLAGNLLAYGNGLTTQAAGQYPQQALLFTQTFDAAGRLNSVGSSWSDATHPQTLFSAPVYTPFNALSNWRLGTQLSTTRTYDVRLRVTGQSSAH